MLKNIGKIRSLYFDYQASTPVSGDVLVEMQPYFMECFANPHSSDHALGWQSAAAIATAGAQVARLIGADPDEIIFTSGATEANNAALLGVVQHAIPSGSRRRRVLLSSIEHKSVLSVGRVLSGRFGLDVCTIPVNTQGRVEVETLERLLDQDVLIVSIMAVNNEIGTIQDVASLSKSIRASGAVFHCDAAQAPMAMDLRRITQEVDLLSLSSHKMYGPKGVGALYIRRDLQGAVEPLIYGGEQQGGLRAGTMATPLCVGMGAAAERMALDSMEGKRNDLRALRDRFSEMLMGLPWPVSLYGPTGLDRHPGNLAIGFTGLNSQDILGALQPHLAASTGSACSSGIPEPSHVLKAIGLTSDQAKSVMRLSLGFETTLEDVYSAVEQISQALRRVAACS